MIHQNYKWSINRDYNFSPTGDIFGYSMVNVPKTGTTEEYLLLIGGSFFDTVEDKFKCIFEKSS